MVSVVGPVWVNVYCSRLSRKPHNTWYPNWTMTEPKVSWEKQLCCPAVGDETYSEAAPFEDGVSGGEGVSWGGCCLRFAILLL